MQGSEVLGKIESVGDEDGTPTATVKIIYCGELLEGKICKSVYWSVIYCIDMDTVQDFAIEALYLSSNGLSFFKILCFLLAHFNLYAFFAY